MADISVASDTRIGSEIWLRFEKQLRTYVRGRVDPAWVEDVVGSILVRLVKNSKTLANADNPAAYVQRVSKNMVTDHCRRRGAEQRALAEVEAHATTETDPDDTDEAELAITRCMAPFIEQLPRAYRDTLVLTELNQLPQKEAAMQLGLSLSGLKSRVQRGRAQLKRAVINCCSVEIDRRGGIVDYEKRLDDDKDC